MLSNASIFVFSRSPIEIVVVVGAGEVGGRSGNTKFAVE